MAPWWQNMSLRMNTKDVVQTGLSFLVVVVVLHVVAVVLSGLGFLMFELLGEETCNEWTGCYTEPTDASLIVGLIFWIPAGIILIAGYIGIWTKLLTDSIAVGVYKANNADPSDLVIIQNQPAQMSAAHAVAAAPNVAHIQEAYQQGQQQQQYPPQY